MRLTPDQQKAVLHIAREHGTIVAAAWAGCGRETVISLRKRFDGYDRGRGHPTTAEKRAMAVRDDCQCPRCRAARGVNEPPLTPEQQARVEANMGLVGFVLRGRRLPDHVYDDAFQDGLMGLMRAARKFDPDRGFQFSTYALYWIRQFITRGRGTYEGRSFRTATYRPEAGTTWQQPVSLDAPLGDEGDLNLGTLIADPDPGPDEHALVTLQLQQLAAAARRMVLDPIDSAIVDAIFTPSDESWAQRDAELAAHLHTSPSAIRRRRLAMLQWLRSEYDRGDLEAVG